VTSGLITSLPGHFRSPEITWRHFPSRDCLLRQATVLQDVKRTYTQVLGLLQPLPGDFRSNDVTTMSLPVTWGHVTSFPVTWLPPTASYSLEQSEIYSIHEFSSFYSHFQVTSGLMTSLPGHFPSLKVLRRHFLSRDCPLRKATALLEMYSIRQF